MRTLSVLGYDVLVTNSRGVNKAGLDKACECITKFGEDILNVTKGSIVILVDCDNNSIVIERLQTDTFTLHVQYVIKSKNVFQIS